jgi:hypothetical protein
MPLDDALKKAIIQMPPKEKDKLLLRLIGKDKALSDRLYFELIEDSSTTQERRQEIKSKIVRLAQMAQHTPGWILMDMRTLSSDIAYHVKVTKDKYGEIELNLYLLNAFFEYQPEPLRTYTSRTEKCAVYMTKKAKTLLNRLDKLNSDYYEDFAQDVNRLLQQLHAMCTQHYARQMSIPREWP